MQHQASCLPQQGPGAAAALAAAAEEGQGGPTEARRRPPSHCARAFPNHLSEPELSVPLREANPLAPWSRTTVGAMAAAGGRQLLLLLLLLYSHENGISCESVAATVRAVRWKSTATAERAAVAGAARPRQQLAVCLLVEVEHDEHTRRGALKKR